MFIDTLVPGSVHRNIPVGANPAQRNQRERRVVLTLHDIDGSSAPSWPRRVRARVTNLGTAGVGYINGDLTVALARLPLDEWIGVQADSHWAADGIAVGAATWFDHVGAFGTGLVTAVSTPRRRSTSPTTRSLRGPFRHIVPPRPARVDLLLGIDMGTGSTKGVLVDARQPIGDRRTPPRRAGPLRCGRCPAVSPRRAVG